MKNAVIRMRLADFLNVLDARAYITIFVKETEPAFSGLVYEALTNKAFMDEYGDWDVSGLSATMSLLTMLIREEVLP